MRASATPPPHQRMLDRLEGAMARAVHPVDRACLRAERAAYLARLGRFEVAQSEVEAVQEAFSRQPHAAVSAWLCIAQALQAYFTNLSGSARDKLQRAYALSTAARLPQLQAVSAAWLAHLDYTAHAFEAMALHLRQVFEHAAPDNHSALGRASLVVAQALHFCGQPDAAQPWYVRVREHARQEGDDATLTALAHNLAWLQAVQALQARLFAPSEPSSPWRVAEGSSQMAWLGAQSAQRMDEWLGIQALDASLPLLRATVHSAQAEPLMALSLYREHLQAARQQGLGRMSGHFLAQMAWCEWQLGQEGAALATAERAAQCLDAFAQVDDLAMAHHCLSQLYERAGQVAAHAHHQAQAEHALARYRALQSRGLALLQPWSLSPPPSLTEAVGVKPVAQQP
jgi:hypothetical protein